jgi:hypothetical protein
MAAVSCSLPESPFPSHSSTPDSGGSTAAEAQTGHSSARPKPTAAAGGGSDEQRQLRLVDPDAGPSQAVRPSPAAADPSAHPTDRLPDAPDGRSLASYAADLGPGSACFCCGTELVGDMVHEGALDCPACGARVERCVAA